MTPAEGYALAGYQRPGVRIVMGPEDAREGRIKPLTALALHRQPAEWKRAYGEDTRWLSWVEERLGDD